MQIDSLADLRVARRASGRHYHEFLRVPALSAGVYEIPAGAPDPQQPHSEDEVYYVIAGRAAFECAGTRRDAAAGDVIYVEAGVPHRFVDVAEDLTVLVVFAPPERQPVTSHPPA